MAYVCFGMDTDPAPSLFAAIMDLSLEFAIVLASKLSIKYHIKIEHLYKYLTIIPSRGIAGLG